MIRTLRHRAALAAAGTVVLLAAGGGATAALAATADSTPTATPAACRVHLRAELLGAMPARLRHDLKTLRAEPAGERADERKAIRTNALSGAYGAKAQHLARIVAGARADGTSVWASLPEALQADLKDLRATEPRSAERAAKAKQIEQKALAGDYGTTVQQRAKTVQERFQKACAAKSE